MLFEAFGGNKTLKEIYAMDWEWMTRHVLMFESRRYISAYRRDEENRHTVTEQQRKHYHEQQKLKEKADDAALAGELKILAGLWLSEKQLK